MTSPDHPNVPGAVGALSMFAGKTQDSWLAETQNGILGHFDQVDPVNAFIVIALRMLAQLLSNVPLVGDTLEDVVNNIADGLNQTNAKAVAADTKATQASQQAVDAVTLANQASGNASSALTQAQAAANAAAAAQETADVAYDNASYWEAECVVSSAEVLLGANELLIGLCQNVPTGKTRRITDLHIALQLQPSGMTLETKKWNSAGTSASVIHTATLGANVTRISFNNLGIDVADKERIFWNVANIVAGGGTPPNVLQCLVFGVIY